MAAAIPALSVGIDPGIRHTGIAVLGGGDPLYVQLDTTPDVSVVEAASSVRTGVTRVLHGRLRDAVVVVERQLPEGAVNGWLQMVAMVAVLEGILSAATLEATESSPRVCLPYPNQVKAYIAELGVGIANKNQIRRGHRALARSEKLLSSHLAEAWFMARMGQAVAGGRTYRQAPTVPKLQPWPIFGQESRPRRRKKR